MGFEVRKVRDGERVSFSIREILKLLGDKINDEIQIEGEVYRISSCRETSSVSLEQTLNWVEIQIQVDYESQSIFTIEIQTEDYESIQLKVNSIPYSYEKDFHIEQARLLWHGEFSLDPSDQITLSYPMTVR